ncbi:MAG TPA: GNAT family N-acetyltransferase [Vicinamibacterales bacterium]|jgi:GNAT superfamily N-acetyltransferase|nr:GNAT family N-acetyltransferase [Vicinamibacterales bacterium]
MTDGAALSISQFLDAWRLFGQAWPASRIESAAGVDYVFTGLPMTGMIAQAVAPTTRVPEGLQLDEPRDADGCTAMLDVNRAAYGMDLAASRPAYGVPAFWAGHVPVLGRVAGGAATSAAVLMAGGYRYVALVATDPAHQKRGFAEAVMRRALTIAEERYGPCPTFLHATDAGRPIYARMGYEAVSTHTCFIDKRFLAGH